MTGADVLRQVREAMGDDFLYVLKQSTHGYDLAMAKQALAPCTVLTPEEAAQLRGCSQAFGLCEECLALLSPDPGDLPHDPPLNEDGC